MYTSIAQTSLSNTTSTRLRHSFLCQTRRERINDFFVCPSNGVKSKMKSFKNQNQDENKKSRRGFFRKHFDTTCNAHGTAATRAMYTSIAQTSLSRTASTRLRHSLPRQTRRERMKDFFARSKRCQLIFFDFLKLPPTVAYRPQAAPAPNRYACNGKLDMSETVVHHQPGFTWSQKTMHCNLLHAVKP